MLQRGEPGLRSLSAADSADVLAAFKSHPDMARQGRVEALADANVYVGGLLDPDHPTKAFAITDADRLVGHVAVTIDETNRSGWFWYWMNRTHRGRGWTGRAAGTLADLALRDWGLTRLELGHRVNNPASGQVARAAGFLQEGIDRGKFLIDGARIDVATYGRLATDPAPAFVPLPIK